MDKNSIRKFATWARRELIQRVITKAEEYGISESGHLDEEIDEIRGQKLSEIEKKQRQALIRHINNVGFQNTIEEAAYTWFNRFCALRFMEVNGYLPSHVRVFTDDDNAFNPQILTEAIQLGDKFDNINMDTVFSFIEKANAREELYRYLIITQCNALKNVLPGMFTKIENYIELLFPSNILDQDSILGHLISDIPEEYFQIGSEYGQIEIIGWLYQYYISERHEEVVDPLHGKVVSAEDIPAATQLFTTDWVVRYIVDNSVGRYWIDHNPDSKLADELPYYVHHDARTKSREPITPQDVTVFDPCVGSGHFLVYAIDVLMKIYREYGYSDRDAISEIIRHNLFALDIDQRATQLAYFAVMMKGCQYDRRFLRRGAQPQIYSALDSSFVDDEFLNYFCGNDKELLRDATLIAESTKTGMEIGSLALIPDIDFEKIQARVAVIEKQKNLFHDKQLKAFRELLNVSHLQTLRYAAVVTNPPYLNKYDSVLKAFLQKNYKDYSGDLFSVFIYRCIQYCKSAGYAGLMTPNVWMFIKSYEKLRRYILTNHSITTLVQMAKGAFYTEATVDVCAFVVQSERPAQDGVYFRLEDFTGNMDLQNEKLLDALQNASCAYKYDASAALFQALPGMPIGYWAGDQILEAFKTGRALEQTASPRQGLATTDNNKYLRHWFEIEFDCIGFGMDRQTATNSEVKWFPYNKGGEFRKWYGNQDYIVNYYHDGFEIKSDVLTKYPYLSSPNFVVKNPDTYFKPCLSWSKISSGSVAFRYFPQGFLYDVSGCSIFFDDENDLYYYAAFLNGVVCKKILEIISPTLNYETGHIAILPIIKTENDKDHIKQLVEDNIKLVQEDWNAFETSWSFKRHALI